MNPSHVYTVSGSNITSVDEVVDLGFTITSNLHFGKHCNKVFRLAFNRAFTIYRSIVSADQQFLLAIYTTYIRPLLEYGTCVFNPHDKASIALLERVQNYVTRLISARSSLTDLDSSQRNSIMGLQSLQHRRHINDIVMFYKILAGFVDVDKEGLFELRPSRLRGNDLQVVRPRFRLLTRQHVFNVRVTNFSHLLPSSCLNTLAPSAALSPSAFKRRLHLLRDVSL